jgi:hypothetical protein
MQHPSGQVKSRALTSLDNIHSNILNASLNLLLDKRGRDDMDVLDTQCILCRQGCRGRHGVASMGGKGLLIRFQAAATYCLIEY